MNNPKFNMGSPDKARVVKTGLGPSFAHQAVVSKDEEATSLLTASDPMIGHYIELTKALRVIDYSNTKSMIDDLR